MTPEDFFKLEEDIAALADRLRFAYRADVSYDCIGTMRVNIDVLIKRLEEYKRRL